MLPFNHLTIKVLTGTTDGTAGTRSSHAHSLPYAPSINRILVVPKASDNDTDSAAAGARAVALVSVDTTNVVVKSQGTSVAFTMFIFLDKDDGGRN